MSAWRGKAIEHLPEFRDEIERAESPGMLWVEVGLWFHQAFSTHNEDMMARVFLYAQWCVRSKHTETAEAPLYAFYEHLPKIGGAAKVLHRYLTQEEFNHLETFFRYLTTDEEFEQFKSDYLAGFGRKKRPKY
jgi:hypothetical protein